MSFLTPYMLWGALAAGIPIALHLFYRSRYRKLPWAAMKFLLTSIEQTSRRLKFQELLLLLLRILLLVLLALALARPSTSASRGSAQGDAVDAVMVFDVSASMGAREGPASRLEQAKAAALAVVEQLPAHSSCQVIVCSDRATLVGPRIPGNLEEAKQIIQEIPLSHQATDLLPGVVEAARVLARGQAPNKELYLLGDMQKRGWDQQAGPLTDKLREVGKTSTVYLVRAGTREPRNVAVVDIVPQSGIPHTGERAGFSVLVRNSGKEPVRNLRVSLTVDGKDKQKETQPIAELAPGSTLAIPVTIKLDKVGLRILSAQVEADELDADNRFDQVLYVRDQVRVLVVDGAPDEREPEKSASFFLMHALAPVRENERSKYHIQPRLVPAGHAAASLLAEQDVCILANVAVQPGGPRRSESLPADFTRHLANFVRQGHGLIIFAGDNVAADAYNRLFFERNKLLPAKLGPVVDLPPDKPLHLDRTSLASPFFWKFRDDEHYLGINKVEVQRALAVEEPPRPKEGEDKRPDETVNVLLRYSDGKPAIVTRKVGTGEVMLITTSGDAQWTDWPLRFGFFVPFLDVALSQLLHTQAQTFNVRAGTPIHYYPAETDTNRVFAIVDPDGKRVRLGQPATEKGRPVVTATSTPRAGIYRIIPADLTAAERAEKEPIGVPFAVVPDLRETENLESLTDGELDQRLGFPVIHLAAGADSAAFSGAERLKHEWTMWLLAAVLVVALLESGLAWLCGRAW